MEYQENFPVCNGSHTFFIGKFRLDMVEGYVANDIQETSKEQKKYCKTLDTVM